MPPVVAHPFIAMAVASMGAETAYSISSQNSAKKSAVTAGNMQKEELKKLEKAKAAAASGARDAVDSRRAAMTQTIFTNPLGIAGQANVARKTLLGQ